MADGNYGKRNINIDLTVATARTIRDPAKKEWVKIDSIFINAVASGTGSQNVITLREETASTGNILFQFQPSNGQVVQQQFFYDEAPAIVLGLLMDAMTAGWASGIMIVNTK